MKQVRSLALLSGLLPVTLCALEETPLQGKAERWRGCYYYATEMGKPGAGTRFYADLTFYDTTFEGLVYEDSFIDGQEGQRLMSAVMGMSYNGMVSFSKGYDPESGQKHFIMYLGSLNADASAISGAWTIPQSTNFGAFIMTQQDYPCAG
ncbi:MAG TPA: hypothetical protein DEA26_03155 [Oceanospirillales bacterium]|nr:hypothetical protein [Oceanospirillaceae bacterium]HBS41652.1 hypothetical protein [Oceanospirillales bacterium]|tara:strand:+ start:1250 stop:1699 length:450 start_codon:yes stop_codon:yes gene_type:complete